MCQQGKRDNLNNDSIVVGRAETTVTRNHGRDTIKKLEERWGEGCLDIYVDENVGYGGPCQHRPGRDSSSPAHDAISKAWPSGVLSSLLKLAQLYPGIEDPARIRHLLRLKVDRRCAETDDKSPQLKEKDVEKVIDLISMHRPINRETASPSNNDGADSEFIPSDTSDNDDDWNHCTPSSVMEGFEREDSVIPQSDDQNSGADNDATLPAQDPNDSGLSSSKSSTAKERHMSYDNTLGYLHGPYGNKKNICLNANFSPICGFLIRGKRQCGFISSSDHPYGIRRHLWEHLKRVHKCEVTRLPATTNKDQQKVVQECLYDYYREGGGLDKVMFQKTELKSRRKQVQNQFLQDYRSAPFGEERGYRGQKTVRRLEKKQDLIIGHTKNASSSNMSRVGKRKQEASQERANNSDDYRKLKKQMLQKKLEWEIVKIEIQLGYY